jgi:hypothetical protein
MTTKLIQRHFLRGSREFEIVDDTVHARIKAPFSKERLTVSLATLNPEPVVNGAMLEFHGRSDSEPLLALFVNKPDPVTFNAFVDALTLRVLAISGAVGGGEGDSRSEALARNVFGEPPEFNGADHIQVKHNGKAVNPAFLDESIQMLKAYAASEDIQPFLSALEALKADPQNASLLRQVEDAFNDLGLAQGTILTYAPYLSTLFFNHPFDD